MYGSTDDRFRPISSASSAESESSDSSIEGNSTSNNHRILPIVTDESSTASITTGGNNRHPHLPLSYQNHRQRQTDSIIPASSSYLSSTGDDDDDDDASEDDDYDDEITDYERQYNSPLNALSYSSTDFETSSINTPLKPTLLKRTTTESPSPFAGLRRGSIGDSSINTSRGNTPTGFLYPPSTESDDRRKRRRRWRSQRRAHSDETPRNTSTEGTTIGVPAPIKYSRSDDIIPSWSYPPPLSYNLPPHHPSHQISNSYHPPPQPLFCPCVNTLMHSLFKTTRAFYNTLAIAIIFTIVFGYALQCTSDLWTMHQNQSYHFLSRSPNGIIDVVIPFPPIRRTDLVGGKDSLDDVIDLRLFGEGGLTMPLSLGASSSVVRRRRRRRWGDDKKWTGSFPTGAFWTNLIVKDITRDVSRAVVTYPYAFRWSGADGLECSYPAFRREVEGDGSVEDVFESDLGFNMVGGLRGREVRGYDELSVTLRFLGDGLKDNDECYMESYLVQGSPYVTVKYVGATPLIGKGGGGFTNVGCLSEGSAVHGLCNITIVDDVISMSGVQFLLSSTKYNQNWILFASEPITFTLSSNSASLLASDPYTGVLRAALIPPGAEIDVNGTAVKNLMKHSSIYPISGTVEFDYGKRTFLGSVDTATIKYRYVTEGGVPDSHILLMLLLPHHVQALSPADNPVDNIVSDDVHYQCIKGNMTFIVGNEWTYRETLPSLSSFEIRDDWIISNPQLLTDIRKNLLIDIEFNLPTSQNVYKFGKQLGRMAQLIRIANLVDVDYRQMMETVYTALVNYLNGFVYDSDFGGIVTKDGLLNRSDNFGNGRYSNHHIHYGYLIYASAILSHVHPTFYKEHSSKIDALVSDIATPYSSSNTRLFPPSRHKLWYDGHSFSSGLFSTEKGKFQDGASEAVNAYYAVYLWGVVSNDKDLMNYGRLLMASEMRGAMTYWNVGVNQTSQHKDGMSDCDRPHNNYVVGELSMLSKTPRTTSNVDALWLNFSPVNNATSRLYPSGYDVRAALSSRFHSDGDGDVSSIDPAWRGHYYSMLSLVDPNKAWKEALANIDSMKLETSLSKTQVLYFIGRRVKETTTTTKTTTAVGNVTTESLPSVAGLLLSSTRCSSNPKCRSLGITGECCPTISGTFLKCCSNSSLTYVRKYSAYVDEEKPS